MRHPTHDYASPGAYFVTICAHQRHLLFEDSAVNEVINWAWNQIPQHFPPVEIDAFVVMPNHVHGVVFLHQDTGAVMVGAQHAGRLPSLTRRQAQPTLSIVVRAFKAAVTRELRLQELWDDNPFWQRNFYDRVIRDEPELNRIREYIACNPTAWRLDNENPHHSADEEYVRNWGWLENGHVEP